MQFNPKIGFVLGIFVTIETAISGGLLNLTNAIPTAYIPSVVAWSSILAFAGSTILTFLHAFSNGQTGPMVADTPLDTTVKATDKAIADLGSLKSQALAGTLAQPTKAPAIALLILGTLILGLLQPGAAYAQTPQARPAFRPTGDLIKDIATSKQNAQAEKNEGIDDLVSKLDKLALPDFEFALAQAQAAKNDVTIPCWSAWVDLIKARQAAATDPSGQPIPVPDPHIITAIERISELLAILRPDSKISLACVQIAATAGKDVGTMITGILSGGALGLFKLPIPIGPIP